MLMRKKTKKAALALAVVVLLMASALSQPLAQERTGPRQATAPRVEAGGEAEAVIGLLQQLESLPDKASFERAAKRPEVILESIAAQAQRPMLQLSALDALARFWPSTRVLTRVQRAIEAKGQPLYLRLEYVAILGRGAFGERAIKPLLVLLGSKDLQLRLAAASALGRQKSEASRAALRSYLERDNLKSDKDGRLLRERIERTLRD
jgi:hypothetical protein